MTKFLANTQLNVIFFFTNSEFGIMTDLYLETFCVRIYSCGNNMKFEVKSDNFQVFEVYTSKKT